MLGRRDRTSLAEQRKIADGAISAALLCLSDGNARQARNELKSAPRRLSFADGGWRVSLVAALIDFALGKRKQGLSALEKIFERLDETSLSRDDKGYLRLFALYRAIENTKDGRAPESLRARAEDFRFDSTLVMAELKAQFPLRRATEDEVEPPPMPKAP